MKKTLLSIGTIVSTIAPVASVIACGDGDVPGHEAPYSITISADAVTPTQANVDIKLKGFVSDSYIKEIKSRIAESIAKLNKDELKYSTINIRVGNTTIPIDVSSTDKWIHTSPLTDANKNDLDAIHNFMDSDFDDLINQIKSVRGLKKYFQKEVWENIHHQIDKLDQDEVKLKLLKLFGFENITNPDVINFEYELISNKCIDLTLTRTNVTSTPELQQKVFWNADTQYAPFLEGEKMNILIQFNYANKYDENTFDSNNDIYGLWFKPGTSDAKYGVMGLNGAAGSRNSHTQLFKLAKYLLKSNGYSDELTLSHKTSSPASEIDGHIKTLANSASKVFTYGDNGQNAGINSHNGSFVHTKHWQLDFDKKTFNIKLSSSPFDQKQWIFGTDGHLVIEPTKEWTMEFEGTYELNDAGDAVGTITSLTKLTATDGTHTIHLLESSAKLIVKAIMNDLNMYLFFNGW